jgi:hypothetical protein
MPAVTPKWGMPELVLSILAAMTGPSLTAPPVSASTGGGAGGAGSGGGAGAGAGVVELGSGLGLGEGEADELADVLLSVERPPPDEQPASRIAVVTTNAAAKAPIPLS